MKIKPIAKYHIQTSEEIRRIVVALTAEYDTFPSETVSAIRDELKGLFIAGIRAIPSTRKILMRL